MMHIGTLINKMRGTRGTDVVSVVNRRTVRYSCPKRPLRWLFATRDRRKPPIVTIIPILSDKALKPRASSQIRAVRTKDRRHLLPRHHFVSCHTQPERRRLKLVDRCQGRFHGWRFRSYKNAFRVNSSRRTARFIRFLEKVKPAGAADQRISDGLRFDKRRLRPVPDPLREQRNMGLLHGKFDLGQKISIGEPTCEEMARDGLRQRGGQGHSLRRVWSR